MRDITQFVVTFSLSYCYRFGTKRQLYTYWVAAVAAVTAVAAVAAVATVAAVGPVAATAAVAPVTAVATVGGPAQVFLPKSFLGRRPTFSKQKKHPKNKQTPNKERPFFDTMRIAPTPSLQFYDWSPAALVDQS
jgi:hypothetical protein